MGMTNILSFFLASAYSGISSLYGAVVATCKVNGQIVDCPSVLSGSAFKFINLLVLALTVFMIVSLWIIFKKAGKPGWAAIIPIYNSIIMLEIAGKPTWWIILYFIPFVNIVISIIVIYNFAKAFGKGGGFTVGLVFLPFIFYPILAFGKSTYMPAAQTVSPSEIPPQAAA